MTRLSIFSPRGMWKGYQATDGRITLLAYFPVSVLKDTEPIYVLRKRLPAIYVDRKLDRQDFDTVVK